MCLSDCRPIWAEVMSDAKSVVYFAKKKSNLGKYITEKFIMSLKQNEVHLQERVSKKT